MAELADAQRSGRCMGFHVQVRILFGALLYSLQSLLCQRFEALTVHHLYIQGSFLYI